MSFKPPIDAQSTSGHETATEQAMRQYRMVDYGVLDKAAKRCDGYLMQYGLEVTWQLHVLGLKLTAQWGADKFERYVSWQEVAQANFDVLERTEQAALAGLSS